MATRYPISAYLNQMTAILGISPARVLGRLGLSGSLANDNDLSVGADMYFRLWDAICAEADRPGIEMDLAMAYARGPLIPPLFAFSCAETLVLGLTRLCDFKPLVGPCKMEVTRDAGELTLTMSPSEEGAKMSSSMGLLEVLFVTECARSFTGTHVKPRAATLPGPLDLEADCIAYLGVRPTVTGIVSLTFSAEDADLPLITRSASLWETLEPAFTTQLETRLGTTTMTDRMKRALTAGLPGGSTSIEDMARRLNISKRSLQRRLSEEGTSFKDLLSQTRFEMSKRYLMDSSLSVPEISYLLGFRDTSSFFRAFHGWTGTTPGDYRASRAETPLETME